jgi:hypothetical protein
VHPGPELFLLFRREYFKQLNGAIGAGDVIPDLECRRPIEIIPEDASLALEAVNNRAAHAF